MVGRDGRDGIAGKDGAPGLPGADGRDGLGLEDMRAEFDGERTVNFIFERGEQKKEFPFTFAMVLDRGVFKEGQAYQKGDSVSYAGSWWIAQDATSGVKPGESKNWRLAVKKGDKGAQGPQGHKGMDGTNGKDGRNMNPRW